MPPRAKVAPGDKASAERPVLYKTMTADVRAGDRAIDEEEAKAILGWEVFDGKGDVKDDYLLIDHEGNKIVCRNNAHNRPFNETWARALAQMFLKRQFATKGPNGETLIIGRTGMVLSAQHRLIGYILACQMYRDAELTEHWKQYGTEPPKFETFVAYGVDETDESVRTLDNVRPRSDTDVLYTSGVFGTISPSKREALAKITGHSVKLLWSRTRRDKDAFSPYRTTQETIEFVEAHRKLVDCVKYIVQDLSKYNTRKDGPISRYLGPGTAAGLMYLMGCSGSEPEKYVDQDPRNEKALSWDLLPKAKEFWAFVAQQHPKMVNLKKKLAHMEDPNTLQSSLAEKMAVFIKAWNLFKEDKPVSEKGLELKYDKDGEGNDVFADPVTLGGIDLIEKEDVVAEAQLTPEELEQRALEERKAHQEKMKDKKVKDDDGPTSNDDIEEAMKKVEQDAKNRNGGTGKPAGKPIIVTKPANNNPKPPAGKKILKGGTNS